jgi:hypothetical protein
MSTVKKSESKAPVPANERGADVSAQDQIQAFLADVI